MRSANLPQYAPHGLGVAWLDEYAAAAANGRLSHGLPAEGLALGAGQRLIEDGAIDRALALGERLLAAVEAFALQFDLPELGDIELPPSVGTEADQAALRSIAPLYFAAEIEQTRLLSAVEMLAGIFVSGGLQADPGAASPLLIEFWRKRQERLNEAQRRALFAHIFGYQGGPALATSTGRSNAAFETLMIDLTEDLARDDPAAAYNDIQIRMSARQLAANLIARGGGMAAFAARDLLPAIKTALEILKQPAAQQAAGANSVWLAVRNLAQMYLNEEVEIGAHVTRAKAGMLVLAWLAEVLPELELTGAPLVNPGDQVVGAALGWMQASLNLAEQSPMAGQEAAWPDAKQL